MPLSWTLLLSSYNLQSRFGHFGEGKGIFTIPLHTVYVGPALGHPTKYPWRHFFLALEAQGLCPLHLLFHDGDLTPAAVGSMEMQWREELNS